MSLIAVGQTVTWRENDFTVTTLSDDKTTVKLVNTDGVTAEAPVGELTPQPFKVTIRYFKSSAKWYCDDEDIEWPTDENHYTRWKPFSEVVRLTDMFAVCMETPLGYPQFAYPRHPSALEHIEDVVARIRCEPPAPRASCPKCRGTCGRANARCQPCAGTGLVGANDHQLTETEAR